MDLHFTQECEFGVCLHRQGSGRRFCAVRGPPPEQPRRARWSWWWKHSPQQKRLVSRACPEGPEASTSPAHLHVSVRLGTCGGPAHVLLTAATARGPAPARRGFHLTVTGDPGGRHHPPAHSPCVQRERGSPRERGPMTSTYIPAHHTRKCGQLSDQ